MTVPLFQLPAGARRRPASPQVKRTARQRFLITTGLHPLSTVVASRMLRLHPNAARDPTDRTSGPRCRDCAFRGPLNPLGEPWEANTDRCWVNRGARVTRGAATALRAWWPACEDWAPDLTGRGGRSVSV